MNSSPIKDSRFSLLESDYNPIEDSAFRQIYVTARNAYLSLKPINDLGSQEQQRLWEEELRGLIRDAPQRKRRCTSNLAPTMIRKASAPQFATRHATNMLDNPEQRRRDSRPFTTAGNDGSHRLLGAGSTHRPVATELNIAVKEFTPGGYGDYQRANEFAPLEKPISYNQPPSSHRSSFTSPYRPTFSGQGTQSSVTSYDALTSPISANMKVSGSFQSDSINDGIHMMKIDSTASWQSSNWAEEMDASSGQSRDQLQSSDRKRKHNIVRFAEGGAGGSFVPPNATLNDALFQELFPPTSDASQQLRSDHESSAASTVSTIKYAKNDTAKSSLAASVDTIVPMSRDPSSTGSYAMVKIHSSDGSIKDAVEIPKAKGPSRASQEKKVYCDYPDCRERPEGYNGEHEMQRHRQRAHAVARPVFVCVNRAERPAFLNNCKACNEGKVYNADYNAAEHLRRIHFNPRKSKGRKRGQIPEEEKRGGKGGGGWPKMDVLRKYMITFDINQNRERISMPKRVDETSNVIMPDISTLGAVLDADLEESSQQPIPPLSAYEDQMNWSNPATDVDASLNDFNMSAWPGGRSFDSTNPASGIFEDFSMGQHLPDPDDTDMISSRYNSQGSDHEFLGSSQDSYRPGH